MHRIFIGYDKNETVALHVLANSLMRHASKPIAIIPLMLKQLPMTRARHPDQSTDFSFSRFLVPWLSGYGGYSLFMDCDMLCRADIVELFEQVDPCKAVSVVKHDYVPKTSDKFLEQTQSKYQKKNWSSVMLFNNLRCIALTPEYVNSASGLDLHQFKWLKNETLIGELPPEWNHLVIEYPPNPDAKIAHYTLGTPCFQKYGSCEFADEWKAERALVLDYNPINAFSLPERVAA